MFISLIVEIIVVALLYYLVTFLPLPAPAPQILQVLFVIILVLIVLSAFFGIGSINLGLK
jgi:uncharacterized membrane protein YtjA (UPF0391 family)